MKTMGRFSMLVALLLPGLSVQAQRSSWLVRAVKAVGAYLDSSTVRGIDRSYIDAPKQPWQVMVRYNANQMNLTMYSHFYRLYGQLVRHQPAAAHIPGWGNRPAHVGTWT